MFKINTIGTGKKEKWYREINIIDIIGVVIILAFASLFQYILKELPCPLCLLQRAGFFLIGMGFLFNLRFGAKPSHYAISTLGALFTAAVATRQILLHILPGSGAYGSPFLGLHLYTWVFIASLAFLAWISFQLMLEKQFEFNRWFAFKNNKGLTALIHAVFVAVIALGIINMISVYLECGFKACPEEPKGYKYRLIDNR